LSEKKKKRKEKKKKGVPTIVPSIQDYSIRAQVHRGQQHVQRKRKILRNGEHNLRAYPLAFHIKKKKEPKRSDTKADPLTRPSAARVHSETRVLNKRK